MGILPISAKPRFLTQYLVCAHGSEGQEALSSEQHLSRENIFSQSYSVLPRIDLPWPPASSSNPQGKRDKSEWSPYPSLSLCHQTPGLTSSVAPEHQAGCSASSATKAMKQKPVSRENVTEYEKTAKLRSPHTSDFNLSWKNLDKISRSKGSSI